MLDKTELLCYTNLMLIVSLILIVAPVLFGCLLDYLATQERKVSAKRWTKYQIN